MKANLLMCALCACVMFAGCKDKEKELADLARVAEMRETVKRQVVYLEDIIAIERAENTPGYMKREVIVEKVKNILAKPADASQLPKLLELSKELSGAQAELQGIVDKRVEELHKANELNR